MLFYIKDNGQDKYLSLEIINHYRNRDKCFSLNDKCRCNL